MQIWLLSILIGCLAGAVTPAVWWCLQNLEWILQKVDPSLPSRTTLSYSLGLPLLAAFSLFVFFAAFRAYRSADGFTYFISDLHFQDGRRKIRYSFVHAIGTFLLLLGQGIVGVEGVCMELLTSLASRFAQFAKLSTNQVRTLAACGATAAIAAVLGQPTAAFLFVVELLYGWGSFSFSMGTFAVTAFVAASVSQSLTSPTGIFSSLFGTDGGLSLVIRTEGFDLTAEMALFCVVVVSICAALLASFTIWVHRKTDKELHGLFETRRATDVSAAALLLRLGMWASLTAVALYLFPLAMGTGVGLLHDSMSQGFLLSVALLALTLRILMGAMAYSVIGSMGLILPTLVAGGLLGACISIVAAPFLKVGAGTVALLSMGAYFSAAFGTPVAASALVFGYATGMMTNSALFLFTALLTNFGAHYLTSRLQADRLASMGLYRHGVRFRAGMCYNTLSGIQVRDAMITYVNPVPSKSSIGEAYKKLMESKFSTLPVVDSEGKMYGLVSLADFYGLNAWKKLGEESQVHSLVGVEEMVKPARVHLNPDMNLEAALSSMSDEEFVPVVEGESRYVGLLVKSDLVNLYNKEVVKKAFRRA
ncbi:MAG TPA: chloride channel protein [Bdellovibrionota bacterium]